MDGPPLELEVPAAMTDDAEEIAAPEVFPVRLDAVLFFFLRFCGEIAPVVVVVIGAIAEASEAFAERRVNADEPVLPT